MTTNPYILIYNGNVCIPKRLLVSYLSSVDGTITVFSLDKYGKQLSEQYDLIAAPVMHKPCILDISQFLNVTAMWVSVTENIDLRDTHITISLGSIV